MERRDALRLLAATAVAPRFFDWDAGDLVAGLRHHMGTRRARPASPYAFQLLTPPQQALVDELTELVIPATATPGARQARVVEFIDVILAEWATENDRTLFMNGMADVEARAAARGGAAFVRLPLADRVAICRAMDDELTALRAANADWQKAGRTGPRPRDHRGLFWHHVRQLTVAGYYTSEVGWTRERKNVLIPGIYTPCMPVEGR
ncbi:MAG: gluconate 2-dehydrogenase subunit 3 family protein [Gemmatimonadetes bacterium]|nr:gluconate 2-dehydrogenase subunit 3 family protein [Gemmatimonadota bacterium]